MTLFQQSLKLCVTLICLGSLNACNERDVAIGLAGVAVGITTSNILRPQPQPRPTCRPGFRTECTSYRNFRGRWVQECRDVYDRCLYFYSLNQSDSLINELGLTDLEQDERAITLAQKRSISFTAAEAILNALDEAARGEKQAIFDLGLGMKDLVRLANKQLPSKKSLQAMSQQLDLDVKETTKIFDDILRELEIELKDFESGFWTQCVSRGSWKTPQNNHCQQSFWPGCSPATGATFCQFN